MILIILIVGFVLRLTKLNQSLWLDEAIGAIAAKNFTYHQILTNFLRVDNHPPLYYLLLKFWAGIFGYSEVSLRFPSIIFGLGTIYVTYLIAKTLTKNRYVPTAAALLVSLSSFFIYYSQEARMYAMAAFLASLSVYFFLKLLEKQNNFYWVLFSASITCLVFTDYMPVFLLPIFWIWAILKKRTDKQSLAGDAGKSWLNKFVLAHMPIVGFGILWLPIFLSQKEGGAWLLKTVPDWRNIAGGANVKEGALVWSKFVFGRISLVSKKLYYILIIVSSLPVAASFWGAVKSKKVRSVWFWLIIPLVLGFVVSVVFPAFIYFRYLYIVPAFYLLIAFGAFSFKSKFIGWFIVGFVIIANLLSFAIYISDRTQQREQWRQATEFVESKGNKNNVVIFEYPDPFAPYRWYAKGGIEARGVLDSIVVMDSKKVDTLVDNAVVGKTEVYHFEYLRDLSDPKRIVEERLRQDGFVPLDANGDFYGVGIITRWVRK